MKKLKDYISQQINENLYNGCEELSKYIIDTIKEKSQEKIIELHKEDLKFSNIFFDTLYILINPELEEQIMQRKSHKKNRDSKSLNENAANYETIDSNNEQIVANCIKWNSEIEMFNYIVLNIFIENIDNFSYKIIAHELNHAYEDYSIRKDSKGKFTLDKYIYNYYDNARYLAIKGRYSEKLIGYIEYISTGIEIRSFSKQALLDFKENIHKYKNLDEALEKQAKDNEVFANFILYKNIFDRDKQYKSSRQNIINAYKKIHENDKDYIKESDDKIIKRIEKHLSKFHNALVKEIKTYYKKHYEK